MCLGVPGKILEITDMIAQVDVAGTRKAVNLMLLEDTHIGDYVIIHAGFAIQKINEEVAQETIRIINDLIRQDNLT